MIKKCLFINSSRWANTYNTCKDLISENKLEDILLFDIDSFLKRLHYKNKISISYSDWIASLSEDEIIKLVISALDSRISLNGNINNVIIIGCITSKLISSSVNSLNLNYFDILFVDCTSELLYRNYTITGGELSFSEFNNCMNNERKKLESLLIDTKNSGREYKCFYRKNNNDNLNNIIADYFEYKNIIVRNPLPETYTWPITPRYKLSEHDKYGVRPIHMILGKAKFHSGFDIIANTLTPVKASIGGIVVYSGLDERILSGQTKWNERYGYMVEVVDNYGRKQVYAHLRETLVREGDIINQGDVIALSGCSGGSRVPHLHFEVRKINCDHSGENNTINPLSILPSIDFNLLTERFTEEPYAKVWEYMQKNPWGLTDEDIPYSKSRKYIR